MLSEQGKLWMKRMLIGAAERFMTYNNVIFAGRKRFQSTKMDCVLRNINQKCFSSSNTFE